MNYDGYIKLALNDKNEWISIKEANKTEKYYCPECKTELIVRDGEIKTKHFAHKSLNNCSGESIIHLAYKEALIKCKKLTIYMNGKELQFLFDKIETEKNIKNTRFKADLIGYIDGKEYYIEIFKTHKVDEEKRKMYQENKCTVFEIECYDLYSIEGIISHLETGLNNKYILSTECKHKCQFLLHYRIELINQKNIKEENKELKNKIKELNRFIDLLRKNPVVMQQEKMKKNDNYFVNYFNNKRLCR